MTKDYRLKGCISVRIVDLWGTGSYHLNKSFLMNKTDLIEEVAKIICCKKRVIYYYLYPKTFLTSAFDFS